MARRPARKRTSIPEEESRESNGTDPTSRSRPPLHAARTADPLGGGGFVHLFAADGTGLLVAVALLDYGDFGRSAGFENAASLGGTHFLRIVVVHVRDVGISDAPNRRRQSVVESGALLQHESRRQNAAGGTLQRWPEVSLLGIFLERGCVACDRGHSLVPGIHPVEPALPALHLRAHSSCGRAVHDWPLPDPHLHGCVC